MMLSAFEIQNFRGIEKLTMAFDKTTVLIGENNMGKTSVLEALHICMSRGLNRRGSPFSEYDFYLASDEATPTTAAPLVLTLTFEELSEGEWSAEIDQVFEKVVQLLDDNRKRISFRVCAQYDNVAHDFAVEWCFLDRLGNPLMTAKMPTLVFDLQLHVPVFLLTTLRDAAQHFHSKSTFWSSFTKNPELPNETRSMIEEQVESINQSVLDSHRPFKVARDRIAGIGKLLALPAKDLVSVDAVPARIVDILARTQVRLAAITGAKLPIAQHGAGTQSLSVLFLFQAFLESRLAESYGSQSEPILALEEPEAHLHPSAVRALWSTLDGFSGQKIIATHSGDLLSAVPLAAVRRMARKNGKIEVFSVTTSAFTQRDLEKIGHHIRSMRGSLMFARCWLLVEGWTESVVMPELARQLSIDFDLVGVSCVEFSQCGLKPLIRLAEDLGIEWHVFADGDAAGRRYLGEADGLRGHSALSDRATQISEPDLEHCLWSAGYQAVYENFVSPTQKRLITSAPGTPAYADDTIKAAIASNSKPQLAYAVVQEAAKPGSPGVPQTLQTAIEMTVALAER